MRPAWSRTARVTQRKPNQNNNTPPPTNVTSSSYHNRQDYPAWPGYLEVGPCQGRLRDCYTTGHASGILAWGMVIDLFLILGDILKLCFPGAPQVSTLPSISLLLVWPQWCFQGLRSLSLSGRCLLRGIQYRSSPLTS